MVMPRDELCGTERDSMSLAVAQCLLDFVAAAAPEFGRVRDAHVDGATTAVEEVHASAAGVNGVYAPLIFDDFLGEELIFERNLAERRYVIDPPVHAGLVFMTDENMDVRCLMGAIVDQEDGRRIAIEFDPPFIDRLIGGNAQRPLADRIRVCAYLVRVAGKTIGVFGDPLRVGGDAVGFFCESVRVLRELVRLARLEQGDDAADAAEQADESAETADARPCPLQEGNQIAHENDSTMSSESPSLSSNPSKAVS